MASVASKAQGFSESQRKNAEIIESVLTSNGIPRTIIAAAIVNAHAESRLNPLAIGDGGNSVGLFQLNIRGLGAGMTTAARQDAKTNSQVIAKTLNSSTGAPLRLAYASGERSVSTMTALFTKYIERPANMDVVAAARAAQSALIFPLGIGRDKGSASSEGFCSTLSPGKWLILGVVGMSAVGSVVLATKKKPT